MRSFIRMLLSRYYHYRLGNPAQRIQVSGMCDIKMDGNAQVGKGLYIRSNNYNRVQISVWSGAELIIGDRVFINQGARLVATKRIIIGNDVLIGDDVIILDSDFHGVGGAAVKQAPVVIEDNVWLATRAIILKGVTIGSNSVVAAGAIVTKDVPANSIVTGPAATVRRRFET